MDSTRERSPSSTRRTWRNRPAGTSATAPSAPGGEPWELEPGRGYKEVSEHDRGHVLAAIRIFFGVVMGIDAYFKWLPAFRNGFVQYVSMNEPGQPGAVRDWLTWWVSMLHTNPHLFAYLVAAAETCLAIGLIAGLFSNAVTLVGIPLALGIWSTAEGFGGPYRAGATDVGASIIYVFVYLLLFVTQAGGAWSLDSVLWGHLGPLRFLSSRPASARADIGD